MVPPVRAFLPVGSTIRPPFGRAATLCSDGDDGAGGSAAAGGEVCSFRTVSKLEGEDGGVGGATVVRSPGTRKCVGMWIMVCSSRWERNRRTNTRTLK